MDIEQVGEQEHQQIVEQKAGNTDEGEKSKLLRLVFEHPVIKDPRDT